ncbi:hypothetical protein EG328_001905 [Venturia inaequalis]|uniref:Uncharacterized protein n=1 Tax=Venturia inaequalis TaxID=5025 RepID=A0A8H3ZBV5_VENIN|nr:hypothetical protein EG328_001905 [Venturia inaequalis]KAE9994457.1 hypothetical protein EG327_010083 [Venturia inaequalis]
MKVAITYFIFAGLGLNVLAAPQPVTDQSPIRCDGRISNPTTCPVRQLCFHDPITNPENSDQPGVCIGQPCRGFTPHPQHCPKDQVCVRPVNDSASTANLPGHCVPTSLTCTATSGTCDESWSCVAGPRSECTMSEPGCHGLCEPNSWEPKAITARQASPNLTSNPAEATVTPSFNHNPVHCGGFLNDPPLYGLCPRGQVCAHPYWGDHSPKHESTCIGQPCGGLTVVGSPCPDEQVCIPPTGHKSFSNPFTGTCVPQMWSCSRMQACKEGWTCVTNPHDADCPSRVDVDCPGICQNSWAFWEAQTASQASTDAIQIGSTTPTLDARQLVVPTATVVPLTHPRTRPMPTFCTFDKHNGTSCNQPDEFCKSWVPTVHGIVTDRTKHSQCMGKRCRSFFPNTQDCPQGQVCIKPVNSKDATEKFPGRCAPTFWPCCKDRCGDVLDTCVKNPEKDWKDCVPETGAYKGICAPGDWARSKELRKGGVKD